MEDAVVDVAVGVGVPVAANLGMIGLIVVILFIAVLAGILWIFREVLRGHKEVLKTQSELTEKANERAENARLSTEKIAKDGHQAMQNLTDAIRYNQNITPHDRRDVNPN